VRRELQKTGKRGDETGKHLQLLVVMKDGTIRRKGGNKARGYRVGAQLTGKESESKGRKREMSYVRKSIFWVKRKGMGSGRQQRGDKTFKSYIRKNALSEKKERSKGGALLDGPGKKRGGGYTGPGDGHRGAWLPRGGNSCFRVYTQHGRGNQGSNEVNRGRMFTQPMKRGEKLVVNSCKESPSGGTSHRLGYRGTGGRGKEATIGVGKMTRKRLRCLKTSPISGGETRNRKKNYDRVGEKKKNPTLEGI